MMKRRMITNDLDITEPFFDLHILSHQNGLLLLQLQQPHFVLKLLHLVESLFWQLIHAFSICVLCAAKESQFQKSKW